VTEPSTPLPDVYAVQYLDGHWFSVAPAEHEFRARTLESPAAHPHCWRNAGRRSTGLCFSVKTFTTSFTAG